MVLKFLVDNFFLLIHLFNNGLKSAWNFDFLSVFEQIIVLVKKNSVKMFWVVKIFLGSILWLNQAKLCTAQTGKTQLVNKGSPGNDIEIYV